MPLFEETGFNKSILTIIKDKTKDSDSNVNEKEFENTEEYSK